MNRIVRSGLIAIALLVSACMKDAPVGPRAGSVSLKVQFQNGAPGEEIRVAIAVEINHQHVTGDGVLHVREFQLSGRRGGRAG